MLVKDTKCFKRTDAEAGGKMEKGKGGVRISSLSPWHIYPPACPFGSVRNNILAKPPVFGIKRLHNDQRRGRLFVGAGMGAPSRVQALKTQDEVFVAAARHDTPPPRRGAAERSFGLNAPPPLLKLRDVRP